MLGREITALCEPGRHYKIMEVCGGQTHAIVRYGIDQLLPPEITAEKAVKNYCKAIDKGLLVLACAERGDKPMLCSFIASREKCA